MKDSYERNIDYLRISLTDRCQLRCQYCVTSEKIEYISSESLLKVHEIDKIVNVFAKLGVSKIKLTGGEPLLREDIEIIIARLKAINAIEEVTLTTNGILLESKIEQLIDAGLDGINISLDTLKSARYEELTRENNLEKVLRGINKAIASPIEKVKINCVLIDCLNKDEIIGLASLAKDKKIHIRFIELMPMGVQKSLHGVEESYVKHKLIEEFGASSIVTEKLGNGPAKYIDIKGFKGKIGFISAVSQHFCDTCNRVRLSCEGYLKTCLYFDKGVHLKPFLNSENLEQVIKENLRLKPKEHQFNGNQNKNREKKNMIQIGG